MTITTLTVSEFRNLRQLTLSCAPRLNLITGANAAGKTSLLEAVYFLSRGRSFRTSHHRELIHGGGRRETADGVDQLRVTAELEQAGRPLMLGIEYRHRHGNRELHARAAGQPVRSLAELSARLPALLLNPDSHRLLEDGPRERRRFMDWGLFHTQAEFMPVWKRFRAALKNRNAALRSAGDERSLKAWERELAASAAILDRQRKTFCKALEERLTPFLQQTLGSPAVGIDYRRGWAEGQELTDLLAKDRRQERQQGHTRHGPHRADFIVKLKDYPGNPAAVEYLSRGQQKLLVIALTLTLAALYQENRKNNTDTACVLLIDDLPAELDRQHRERVMGCLVGLPLQLFITALEPELLDSLSLDADTCRIARLKDGVLESISDSRLPR